MLLNFKIYAKKQYYAGLFFSLALVYEFAIIIAFSLGDQYNYLLARLVGHISNDVIFFSIMTQFVFFASILIGLSVKFKKITFKNFYRGKIHPISNIYFIYSSGLMIFLFGIISRFKSGGESRIAQYALGFNEVTITPFHFYGATILPLVSFFCIKSFFEQQYKRVVILLIMMAPTLYDLFVAGRRQMFAPILFILFYFILTDKLITNKKKITFSVFILFFSLIVFTIQFSLRYRAMGALSGEEVGYTSYLGNILGPQIFEFVAVGATSLSAHRDFVHLSSPALGFDSFIVFILQNLPILGTLLKDSISTTALTNFSFSSVAPFGALSIEAEGVIFFGYFGIILFGLTVGFMLSILEKGLKKSNFQKSKISFTDIAVFCLASILLFKYRSGFVDIIATSVYFLLLSFSSYIIGFLFFKIFISPHVVKRPPSLKLFILKKNE